MGKLISRLLGRNDEAGEQDTAPMGYREPRREPFAAGWVTDDGKLRETPPRIDDLAPRRGARSRR